MISEGTQIDILMKEYATMREEVLLHFRNTKLHTRYFQLFFTAALVIIWYLFFVADVPAKDAAGKEVSDHLQDILTTIGIKKADLLLYLISALDITSYYFAFDILDSYFCVFLAAARLANIEKQINDTWGRKLLIWESEFQSHVVATFGVSRVAITLYQLLLVAGVSLLLPIYCFYRLFVSQNLTHAALSWVAIRVCLILFVWFIYAFVSDFSIKKAHALRVMDLIVTGGNWDQINKLYRLSTIGGFVLVLIISAIIWLALPSPWFGIQF